MKNIFLIAIAIISISACHSNKKTEEVKTSTEVGVPNVNGNIPDTTNAIKLDMDKKAKTGKDSSK